MSERCCRTCSAYVSTNDEQGECHATRPMGIPMMSVSPITGKQEMRLLSGWPPTTPKSWCRDDWRPAHDHAN